MCEKSFLILKHFKESPFHKMVKKLGTLRIRGSEIHKIVGILIHLSHTKIIKFMAGKRDKDVTKHLTDNSQLTVKSYHSNTKRTNETL